MARVNHVKSARKAQGACGRCGEALPVGSPYRWWSFRFGGKHKRCLKPECSPRASDLTNSDKLSRLYGTQENAADELAAWDREDVEFVKELLGVAASDVREVSEEYAEAAEAMGGAGEELQEKADECEAWADELESAADELEDAETDCAECNGTGEVDCDGCDGEGTVEEPCGDCNPEDGKCGKCDDGTVSKECTESECKDGRVPCEMDSCDEGTVPPDDDWADNVVTTAEDAINACPL